jgi:hypothetical protein
MVDYYPETQQIGLNSFEIEAVISYCANGPGRRERDYTMSFFKSREVYADRGRVNGIERTKYQHEHAGDRLVLPATLEWVRFVEEAFVHWRNKYPASDMGVIGEERSTSPLFKKAQLDIKLINESVQEAQEIAGLLSHTD